MATPVVVSPGFVELTVGAVVSAGAGAVLPPPSLSLPHPAIKTASSNVMNHILEILIAHTSLVACVINFPLNELLVVTGGSGLEEVLASYTPRTAPEVCEPISKIYERVSVVCSVPHDAKARAAT
jgi:hypothetical protein